MGAPQGRLKATHHQHTRLRTVLHLHRPHIAGSATGLVALAGCTNYLQINNAVLLSDKTAQNWQPLACKTREGVCEAWGGQGGRGIDAAS